MDENLRLSAITNNTFDLKSLEKTLIEIKQGSFKYLYNVQKNLSGYKRFDLKMQDLVQNSTLNHKYHFYPRKYVAFIDENFISDKYRKKYRESSFYNKELSLFDVINNPNIFHQTFLVFIKGKLFDTINIMCKEDKTYFIFDISDGYNTTGIPKSYFDELYNMNADITIWLVPNCSYGVYNTNINVLKKYKDGLSLSRFNLINNLDNEPNYITFVNTNEFLFSGVITDTTNSAGILKFYNNATKNFNDKYIHINIFGFQHLLDQIDISGNEKYFNIHIQDMPVPIENIMVFRNVDGVKYFDHNITFKLYYPNIYEIIGNDNNDDLTLYVFYANHNIETTTLKYKNELQLYYTFTTDILERYKDNSIPTIIRDFQPMEFTYDNMNFGDSEYFPDHLKYKCETFKSWFRQNRELLRNYLYNQTKHEPGYYLDMTKINLQSKYRTDNYQEIDDPLLHETFTEPRYVFIFKNDLHNELNFRWFIDGYLYWPDKIFHTVKYDFYYVPVSKVKDNSVIEIEKSYEEYFEQELTFNNTNEFIDILLPDYIKHSSVNDLFLIKSEDTAYIYTDSYIIQIPDTDNPQNFITIDNDSFKNIQKFKICLINDELINVPVKIKILKRSYRNYTYVERDIPDAIEGTYLHIESNNDKRHFRLFRNGRLIPFEHYLINFGETMAEDIIVAIKMAQRAGDEFVIDYTPNKFKAVYYQELISERGFVDLTGYIDKPFDIRWFDVFLNGVKLNKNNIDILTPTKIMIKNVNTRKHLYILQNNRDIEFFRYETVEQSFIDDVWQEDSDFRDRVINSYDIIDDILDDIITEIIDDLGPIIIRFFETFMKYHFINPDIIDPIPDDVKEQFYELFSKGGIVMINADEGGNDVIRSIFPN
jgi:hypothetical protein